jgi:ABC-type Fe3+ transport system permease subunit
VPAVFAAILFLLPLIGLLAATPWADLATLITDRATLDALLLSLECSLAAAFLCVVLGLPLATWLAHGNDLLRSWVRVLITLPMVLPPIVGGLALLLAFGKNGVIGGSLDRWFEASLLVRRAVHHHGHLVAVYGHRADQTHGPNVLIVINVLHAAEGRENVGFLQWHSRGSRKGMGKA